MTLAVVGAHMRGMPLNPELVARGAAFLRAAAPRPPIACSSLPGAVPPKPGLLRVADSGAAIELELWRLGTEGFGALVATVPGPLTIGDVRLEDGSTAKGYLVEAEAVAGASDISSHGGWRAYLAANGG